MNIEKRIVHALYWAVESWRNTLIVVAALFAIAAVVSLLS